jgi:hypothetical protein
VSAADRAFDRAQAIRRRLGGSGNGFAAFPRKPEGMHLQTYEWLQAIEEQFHQQFLMRRGREIGAFDANLKKG